MGKGKRQAAHERSEYANTKRRGIRLSSVEDSVGMKKKIQMGLLPLFL